MKKLATFNLCPPYRLGDLTLPVNFVSAGLRKSVMPEDEGSDGEQPADAESMPACKRSDYPREFGAKKAPKSVSLPSEPT